MALTSVEICTGAGGQALGLEKAGFDHLAVVEIDRLKSGGHEQLQSRAPNQTHRKFEDWIKQMLRDEHSSIPTCGPVVSSHLLGMAEDQLAVILEMSLHPENFKSDWLQWSLAAGLLVEYSTKGLLAAISPSLLFSDLTQTQNMKALPSANIMDWAGIKTVNISTVLSHLAKMGSISNLTKKSGMSVLYARNDAAHMGLAPPFQALTQASMAFLCYLAKDLDKTLHDLYGEKVCQALLNFQRSSEEYVRDLIEGSEREWEEACKSYKSNIQDFIDARMKLFSPDWGVIANVACFICHNDGAYMEAVFDVEYEYEGPGMEPSQHVIWEDEFTCPVCGLTLEGNQIQIAHDIHKLPSGDTLYQLWSSR